MRKVYILAMGLVLSAYTLEMLGQESIGRHYLHNTQVVEIKDNAQDRTYHITIQTPFGYKEGVENGQAYPAIYITDSSYNFPMVEGWMNVAIWGDSVKKNILVGISWEVNTSSRNSRTYDYTPIVDVEWKERTGGADSHLRFIKEEVFEYIESHYSTDPEQRTYIGFSLGGLLGAYAFLSQPALFSNYLLVSPSLWYDDGYIFRLMASGKVARPNKPTKIFISAGELETPEDAGIRNNLLTDAKKFSDNIQAWENKHVSIQFYQVDAAFHSMTFPESMVRGIYWMHKNLDINE